MVVVVSAICSTETGEQNTKNKANKLFLTLICCIFMFQTFFKNKSNNSKNIKSKLNIKDIGDFIKRYLNNEYYIYAKSIILSKEDTKKKFKSENTFSILSIFTNGSYF